MMYFNDIWETITVNPDNYTQQKYPSQFRQKEKHE